MIGKRRLRTTIDRAALLFGILQRRERAGADALTVLTWHRVLPDDRAATYPLPTLAMPVDAFRQQVRWLAGRYEVLPLTEALERARAGNRAATSAAARAPRPLLALTFDDGYHDAGEHAAQVLEEEGVRGNFFVTTGFVGGRDLLWFDRAALLLQETSDDDRREVALQNGGLAHAEHLPRNGAPAAAWVAWLKRCGPATRRAVVAELERAAGGPPPIEGFHAMSVGDLRSLHARGHEIGSHTVTHAALRELDDEALRREIEDSRDALESWLATRVPGFCYPDGGHDERVVGEVERAGHSHACTTQDGLHGRTDDPLRIRRVDVVAERSLDDARRFDPVALRREMCGLYRRRRPTRRRRLESPK
jgi:peptidoglycan/xylan/chitin deacetylase (PgdA/CDA1 family)